MLAAHTLLSLGQRERELYLYDTFAGMSEPSDRDVAFDGYDAQANWSRLKAQKDSDVLAYADLNTVTANLGSTGYPLPQVRFVRGKVEDTIPGTIPESIAILRLDTDWYESTLHELEHLYPRLQAGGVLIIDDYGHWRGAHDAVDEYFTSHPPRPLLQRLDYTGRMGLRPS
jgi:O-methyltransferase